MSAATWWFGVAIGGWTFVIVLIVVHSDLLNRAQKNLEFERRNADKWREIAFDLARKCEALLDEESKA